MGQKVHFSLKYKLLFLLSVLPVISLSLYLLLAVNLFKKDKIAYVFDSSLAVARAMSSEVNAEMRVLEKETTPFVKDFNFRQKKFSKMSEKLFKRSDDVYQLLLFQQSKQSKYKQVATLKGNGELTQYQLQIEENNLLTQVEMSGVAFLVSDLQRNLIWFGKKLRENKRDVIVFALIKSPYVINIFKRGGGGSHYNNFLLNSQQKIIVGPHEESEEQFLLLENWDFLKKLSRRSNPEGAQEIISPKNVPWLVSYARVPMGNMLILSFIAKSSALEVTVKLLRKSVLFFIAFVSFAIIISLFASKKLTAKLNQLLEVTEKVTSGEFDIKITFNTNDEVGVLGRSFNKMAIEISRLMEETADKARMEKELETAKAVQEILFTPTTAKIGNLDIAGYFESAVTCGGDWWFYNKVGDNVFMWIGDVTGHGVSAALITSAAKSATALIEGIPHVTPALALEQMNRAIVSTSQGQKCMTLFLGAYNLETHKFSYANAGHEPAYLFKNTGTPLTKENIVPLNEVNGPSIGQNPDTTYEEYTFDLEAGDALLFYTDGTVDLQGTNGSAWGEMRLLKSVRLGLNQDTVLEKSVAKTVNDIEEYRGEVSLYDDVTFFVCRTI